MAKEDRGFASMDRAKQREIASKGGKAAHQKGTAHEWTSEEARDAGRKGGIASHQRRREQSGRDRPTTARSRWTAASWIGAAKRATVPAPASSRRCRASGPSSGVFDVAQAVALTRAIPADSYQRRTRLPRHSGPSVTKRHSGFCRTSRSDRQI